LTFNPSAVFLYLLTSNLNAYLFWIMASLNVFNAKMFFAMLQKKQLFKDVIGHLNETED